MKSGLKVYVTFSHRRWSDVQRRRPECGDHRRLGARQGDEDDVVPARRRDAEDSWRLRASGTITYSGTSTMRLDQKPTTYVGGSDADTVHMTRGGSRCVHDSGSCRCGRKRPGHSARRDLLGRGPHLRRARDRRRELVLPQAAAAEPRRRGRAGSGKSVGRDFPLCAQGGVTADTAGNGIARVAQQFAGRPTADPSRYRVRPGRHSTCEHRDGEPVEPRGLHQLDERRRHRVRRRRALLQPRTRDAISPNGGYWVDVRVKERNLPSFFGSIGVPLTRNIARARVELRQVDTRHQGARCRSLVRLATSHRALGCSSSGTTRTGPPAPRGTAHAASGHRSRTYATASDIALHDACVTTSPPGLRRASTNG